MKKKNKQNDDKGCFSQFEWPWTHFLLTIFPLLVLESQYKKMICILFMGRTKDIYLFINEEAMKMIKSDELNLFNIFTAQWNQEQQQER